MDFKFSAAEDALRNEVRQVLRENPPDSFPTINEDGGFGSGAYSKEFAKVMGSKGWISMTWPKKHGGQERPLMDLLVVLDELAYANAPASALVFALPMGHSIIEYGTPEVKSRFLSALARGEIHFWLSFSEPQAGSDLLALETRATRDGDHYVVNGQKIWSSMAHLADYGFLLARTNPNVPRHKGLSLFILEKRLDGVDVRPMINMAGVPYHNEVFLDNVRIPASYLLGKENEGFPQMMKGLEVDRFWGRFVKPPFCKGVLDQLIQYCKSTTRDRVILAKDPLIRHKLAESAVEVEACRVLFYRVGWMMQNNIPITFQGSVPKLLADEMGQRLFKKGMEITGPFAQLGEDTKWAPLRGRMQRWYLNSPGHTIAGGTSEIMRNTMATIGLGLPRA